MAVYVALAVVVLAVLAAFVLGQRSSQSGSALRGRSRGRGSGRLAQRVEDQRGIAGSVRRDEYVDSQAAVWEVDGSPSASFDDLFPDDIPVVEPRPSARDAFFAELPYAEEVEEPAYEEAYDPDGYEDGYDDGGDDIAYDDEGYGVHDLPYAEEDEPDAFAAGLAVYAPHEDDDAEGDRSRAAAAHEDFLRVYDEADADRFAAKSRYVRRRAEAGFDDIGTDDERDDEEVGDDGADAEELPAPVARRRAPAGREPERVAREPAAADSGPKPLARRTPKAGEEAYRRPLRLAQTTQRPTVVNRRSPEQIRNMLANYRGGRAKAKRESADDE
jgi:hypothetical protein